MQSPFQRIDLFAAPYKPENYVATVEVPKFAPGLEAEVLIWGGRVFKKFAWVSVHNPGHWGFVEVFAVTATRTVEE